MSVLSIANLRVNFGGLIALDDVFIDVAPNSIVGLIGPNGAGKTTLFNCISGLVTPTSGEISIHGKKVDWPNSYELADFEISRTLQGVGLFSGLSVIENVMMGADKKSESNFLKDLFGLSAKSERKLRAKAVDALAWAGALDLADKTPSELTYPETKRVSIARALVSEPKILLLDEPAGGLGAQDIEWMNSLIHNLAAQCSVILVEHHMDVVMSVCDRLYVLNFGEMIASGDVETVRRNPAVVAAYLGVNN